MPIVNTYYEALYPIQRVLKLYEQYVCVLYVYNVPSRLWLKYENVKMGC